MNNQIYNSKGAEIKIEAFHPGEFLLEDIDARNMQKKNSQIKSGFTQIT